MLINLMLAMMVLIGASFQCCVIDKVKGFLICCHFSNIDGVTPHFAQRVNQNMSSSTVI